jgi:hypothetical protein
VREPGVVDQVGNDPGERRCGIGVTPAAGRLAGDPQRVVVLVREDILRKDPPQLFERLEDRGRDLGLRA